VRSAIFDFLDNDFRPTFVLDIGTQDTTGPVNPYLVYYNEPLKENSDLFERIQSLYDPSKHKMGSSSTAFRRWTFASGFHVQATRFERAGHSWALWSTVIVRPHWKAISGLPFGSIYGSGNDDLDQPVLSAPTRVPNRIVQNPEIRHTETRQLGWTRPNAFFDMSPHVQ
jgi:hypothetical protein